MTIDAILVGNDSRRRGLLRAMLHVGWRACRAWCIKRHTRYALMEMTDEQLHDIGVTRGEARREVEKSFYWDLNA